MQVRTKTLHPDDTGLSERPNVAGSTGDHGSACAEYAKNRRNSGRLRPRPERAMGECAGEEEAVRESGPATGSFRSRPGRGRGRCSPRPRIRRSSVSAARSVSRCRRSSGGVMARMRSNADQTTKNSRSASETMAVIRRCVAETEYNMDAAYSLDVLARKGHWSRPAREFRTAAASDVLGWTATQKRNPQEALSPRFGGASQRMVAIGGLVGDDRRMSRVTEGV